MLIIIVITITGIVNTSGTFLISLVTMMFLQITIGSTSCSFEWFCNGETLKSNLKGKGSSSKELGVLFRDRRGCVYKHLL